MIDTSLIFDGSVVAATGGIPDVAGVTGAAVTTTAASTNVLDMLVARDMGSGNPWGIHIDIITTFTSCTSLTVAFQGSTAVAGTYYTLLTSPVYPVANLIAGAPIMRYAWPLNQGLNWTNGVPAYAFRYYRLYYTIAGSAETTGTVFSYVNPIADRLQFNVPPSNYTIKSPAGEI